MPGASYGLRGAFVNGKFYAISGFATNRVGIYDPLSNSWTTGNPLPQFPPDTGYNLRQYFGCAAANGKIYVIGGDTGGSGARDTNYVYDTGSDSWTSGAPMPGGARYGVAAANLNGLIYVIGGVDANGTYLSLVEIYNPASNSWITGVPLPGALQGMVAEAINGRIYVAGGSNLGGAQTGTFVFDGTSWSSKQSMPIQGNGGSAVVNGKMFVVGCGNNGASSAVSVQAYDPQTDSWSTNYPSLPLGRGDGAVAADPTNGIIYDAGGYNGVNGGFLDELDILPIGSGLPGITNPIDLDYLSTNETFNPTSATWISMAQMPTARQAFGMAVASGGQDGTWSTGPDMPNPAYAVQAATVNGKIYAISGFRFGAQQPGESDTRIYNPATNSWSLGAPVPDDNTCSNFQENGFCYTLRQFAGCAALNGKIYVIGGDTGGTGFEATNLIYDTVANRWSNGAILPGGPRDNLASVALNGKIYTIGGFNGNSNTYFSGVDIYEPTSNSWTAGTPLPGPRAGMAAAVTNGKIYVAGGQDANGPLTDALVFDPAANTWTNIASPPFTNQYCAVLGGKLFIVGAGGTQNIIEAYDPVTNTWSTSFSPMLTPRGAVAAAANDASGALYTIGGDNGPFSFNILGTFEILSIGASNQKIYVAGGQNIDNVCSPVAALESYNPTTDSWTILSPMPTARSDLSAATVNNIIYFIGGSSCAGTVGTVEAYNPSAKQWTNPQAPLQSMTVPRSDTGSAVVNNKVYVFGGNDANGVPQPVLEVYDPAQDQWTRLTDMPSARSMLAGAAFGGKIYAFGGFDGANPTGDVDAYDPGSDSWTPLASMPTPRFASGAGVVNNTIHIFGGAAVPAGGATISHEVATDEVYDPATNTWSTAPSLSTARFGLGGAAINNQLYAVGGLLRGIASVNHLFVYQITATNQPSSYSVESADPNVPLPAWLQIDPTS
jgi:N-acetylneuraminic acid mutarotase